jgi:hypothetical protein
MDSSQKVLKELSDLTRNLDSLAKEVRESNKGNASVQKAVAQSVETKKDESKSAPSAEKSSSDAQKNQESMFSKLLGSVKKSFEDGNELFKSASLKTLQSAGKTLLETGSIKEAAKSGIAEAKEEGKTAAKQKAEQAISAGVAKVTESPDLKQKEKADKEKLTVDGMTNPSSKAGKDGFKTDLFKSTGGGSSKPMEGFDAYMASLSRDEEAYLINGLGSGKITSSDVERMIAEKKKSPEKLSAPASVGSFKTPESLSPKVTPAKAPEEGPKKTFGETVKEEFGKTRLGSTISSISSLIKKKKDEPVAESGMKNETTTLKDQSKAKPEMTKPQEEAKKEPEAKTDRASAPARQDSPSTDKPKTSPPATAGTASADKGKETQISSQDIQDIKGLLSAINTTLNGPLLLKDNKPFRPKSNMLE